VTCRSQTQGWCVGGWGGEERGVHENSNKEKLNLYLDLCNDKHAFGLVFRV